MQLAVIRGGAMHGIILPILLGAQLTFALTAVKADEELGRMSQNSANWAMPTGDFANTRYSQLNQINAANVGHLQVAWTFSTGVLRGHKVCPYAISKQGLCSGPR
jgi:lanthanide-dependent methanol dehydrogenase